MTNSSPIEYEAVAWELTAGNTSIREQVLIERVSALSADNAKLAKALTVAGIALPSAPRIAGVAVLYAGKTYKLPAPMRHHNLLHQIDGIAGPHAEGFYDEDGFYLTREDAMLRAEQTGQMQRRDGATDYKGPQLFSEDVW